MISTHSQHRGEHFDLTVDECLTQLDTMTVTERTARQLIPAIRGCDCHVYTEYCKGPKGGLRKVCMVETGIVCDEFRNWKEAVRFYI